MYTSPSSSPSTATSPRTSISVRISGSLLSLLSYEFACCRHHSEGLLFGHYSLQKTTHVRDENTLHKEEWSIVITGFHTLRTPFHDPIGNLTYSLLNQIQKERNQTIIGYFKHRRKSSLFPTLLESSIYSSLQSFILDNASTLSNKPTVNPSNTNQIPNQNILQDMVVLGLFNTDTNENKATWTWDYAMFKKSVGAKTFSKLPIEVSNLVESTQSQYTSFIPSLPFTSSSTPTNQFESNLRQISISPVISQYENLMLSGIATLKDLSSTLHNTEQQVSILRKEVEGMKKQVEKIKKGREIVK
ncbi:hypothetical protein BKA69DRAFT_1121477 [Paraphysoderma sedebokerense]|nr:hypothetical protein BKA69DRAFT_1121477 [Paraphysoderma sedebokerense]